METLSAEAGLDAMVLAYGVACIQGCDAETVYPFPHTLNVSTEVKDNNTSQRQINNTNSTKYRKY